MNTAQKYQPSGASETTASLNGVYCDPEVYEEGNELGKGGKWQYTWLFISGHD